MKCDSCGAQQHKLHIINTTNGVEQICDECDKEREDEAIRSALYEDALSNGEPWALPDNPELWNPKYEADNEPT